MSSIKKIVLNSSALYIRMIFVMLVNLLATRFLMANFGIDGFGLYNVISSIVVLGAFITGILTVSSQRFISSGLAKAGHVGANDYLNAIFAVHILCFISIIIILEIFGYIYINGFLKQDVLPINDVYYIYHITVAGFSFSIFISFLNSICIAEENMSAYARFSILDATLKLLIAYSTLFVHKNTMIVYALAMLFEVIIMVFVMVIFIHRRYPYYKINNNSTYKFDKQWDGLIHHIASTVQSSIDVILLTIFSNLTNISIYSVYALITNGIRALIVSLTNGIDAFFGKTLITQNSEQVRHKFSLYSFIFYTLTTILLASTLILIVPFVSVYTKNFVDANYVIPTFAYILVFAEFFFVIRYPYSTIVYAKGHFKETKIFSIIEPVVNIIISVLLVKKYGLVGVAIGTLISMPIRTFGFIYYGSTKILETKFINSLKIIIVSFIEMLIVMLFQIFCININIDTYIKWVILAVITIVVITVFVLLVNTILFRNDFNDIIKMIKERKNSNEK